MTAFTLRNDFIRQNAKRAIDAAPDNSRVTIADPSRTIDQNKMFHAIAGDIAKSGYVFAGKERDQNAWKQLLISGHAAATASQGEVLPGLEGEFVSIRESTARMGKARASSLIEYSLAWCANHNIELTDTKRGGFMDERAA